MDAVDPPASGVLVRPLADHYRPGDAADFDRLYRATYPRLLGTLVAMLGDRAAAEDCLHDAFVQAYGAWERWDPAAPAEAWLHRIAVNRAISYRRWLKLREVGKVVRRFGRPAPPPDPADMTRAELLKALRRLPAKQAAAIVLRHFHGYTNREISISLGIPERTVASRLAAAKTRLQRDLSDWRKGSSSGDETGVPNQEAVVTGERDV
jgi:RNA polymerase sigma factor (sigma-70 family)